MLHLLFLSVIGHADLQAEVSKNLLTNPNFDGVVSQQGVPAGWQLYGGVDKSRKLSVVETEGQRALLIEDNDTGQEVGVYQQIAAEGGLAYQATAMVKKVNEKTSGGMYIQLRFLPSDKYHQMTLYSAEQGIKKISVKGVAPPGTKRATLYLYTHRDPTPSLYINSVELVSGVEPPRVAPPPQPAKIERLKNLYLATLLVSGNRSASAIVSPAGGIYSNEARAIQAAIVQKTSVKIPIITDEDPLQHIPLKQNLILLGNRSTNAVIQELYSRFFTLLDLKYPGPGGSVVRTLHNPFGNGINAVFAGGSDPTGVKSAADKLVSKIKETEVKDDSLSLPWIANIELGKGTALPTNLLDYNTWEASKGYHSVGYFGWNSISKHMAMYYMTGREHDAREVLRLSFPDAKARKQIETIDQERLENKDDPLAGPYHYNAHMMVLFWDLIEESPIFSDAERLKVTQAFSRQLKHRLGEHIYNLTQPARAVGSRHGQWSAISLYCLGRYLHRGYPDPVWEHCTYAAQMHFRSLHEYMWVGGESDNLFWYNTGIAPTFSHLLLTGDREPLSKGTLRQLIRGMDALVSGIEPDWALNSASVGFLHKAAYLLEDSRYIDYRKRTGIEVDGFRLGQSWWPDEKLEATDPGDLSGHWAIHRLSVPAWSARNNGFLLDESFYHGSFRSTEDAGGDFILIDGYNGASRNPYHTFSVLELRLAGQTLLKGYRTQVLTRADGLVEPKIAMNAALKVARVLGETAVVTAEVPDAAWCSWRRTLLHRIGKYALFADNLDFRTDTENAEVQFLWELAQPAGRGEGPSTKLHITPNLPAKHPPGWIKLSAMKHDCATNHDGERALIALGAYDTMLMRTPMPGPWMEMKFKLDAAAEGIVYAELLNYTDRGIISVFLDGKLVLENFDHFASSVERKHASLGRHNLGKGEHVLRIQAKALHEGTGKCYVGLSALCIQSREAKPIGASTAFQLLHSEPAEITLRGRNATFEWKGPAKSGERKNFFSLLLKQDADNPQHDCVRLSDNAAGLSLPQAAIAFSGKFKGCEADVGLLAEDHASGVRVSSLSLDGQMLLKAQPAVDLDWDFVAGKLALYATEETKLGFACKSQFILNGKEMSTTSSEAGWMSTVLPAGKHLIEKAEPSIHLPTLKSKLASELKAGLDRVSAGQVTNLANPSSKPVAIKALADFKPTWKAKFKGAIKDLINTETNLVAAIGAQIHILDRSGQVIRSLATDGKIRQLRWWPEHKLLLAGCQDEKVIAFNLEGKRLWTFVSETHPDVYRAGKSYWFKTAPGHEGIHGLYSGVFLNGKSQAFVGSACTLEIINEEGKLIHRLPQFWGQVSHFNIIKGPEGSLNLLASRKYNGTNTAAILNNRTLNPKPRGFHTVPPGHTYVGGWTSLNRHHIFYEDLDGNGEREVICEVNGTWNRVTVWSETGQALYDASFGPGNRIPARNIRDLEVTDLDADGRMEILVGMAQRMLVVLDHQCKRKWSTRLESAPELVKGHGGMIFLALENGTIQLLDSSGKQVKAGIVNGRPMRMAVFKQEGRTYLCVGTSQGELSTFELGSR
jgi:hypothetical protein